MPDLLVTPLVRRLAAQLGVDLSTVTGTGVGGRIRADDVRQAAGHRTGAVLELLAGERAADPAASGRDAYVADLVARQVGPFASPSVTTGGPTWLVRENSRVDGVPPDVRSYADARGVRLGQLPGDPAHFTLRTVDVAFHAQRAAEQAAYLAAYPAPAPEPEGPAVTFTASGIPPAALSQVPQPLRRALAAAETTVEAFRMVQAYAGLSDDDAEARLRRDRAVSCDYGGAGTSVRLPWPT